MRAISRSLAEYYDSDLDQGNTQILKVKKITMGWETELYSFVVQFNRGERQIREERVVRLYAGHWASEKASKEFEMMTYLLKVGYPVPKVFSFEPDVEILGKPFIIMEKIKGHNLMEDFENSSSSDRESLMTRFIELWVNLHEVDVPENIERKATREYIDHQLKSARNRIKLHGLHWLEPVLDWLNEHKMVVPPKRLSIIHRDFHPDNVMVREDGSMVVVDWGAVMIGDYRDDLAWTILLGITYLDPGFRRVVLENYERISGRKISDIEFFEVRAMLRRVLDVVISLKNGPEQMGMRSGALEMMKRDREHFRSVCLLLKEKTGLKVHELEDYLKML